MKKALLFLCAVIMLLNTRSFAQASFLTQSSSDTVSNSWDGHSVDVNVANYIKSTSGVVFIKWKMVSSTIATGWSLDGICDNTQCYSGGLTNYHVSDTYKNTYGDFHVVFGTLQTAPYGSYSVVKADLTDTLTGYTKHLTFIGQKNPLGITSVITSDDDVILFPNPAREFVNVLFSEKAGVRTIAIYNLIGKVMNVYKTTDTKSAKLDIDNIPAGVYFLRLIDSQGHVVTTRRFTRQ